MPVTTVVETVPDGEILLGLSQPLTMYDYHVDFVLALINGVRSNKWFGRKWTRSFFNVRGILQLFYKTNRYNREVLNESLFVSFGSSWRQKVQTGAQDKMQLIYQGSSWSNRMDNRLFEPWHSLPVYHYTWSGRSEGTTTSNSFTTLERPWHLSSDRNFTRTRRGQHLSPAKS